MTKISNSGSGELRSINISMSSEVLPDGADVFHLLKALNVLRTRDDFFMLLDWSTQ